MVCRLDKTANKEFVMKNIKKFLLPITMASLLAGCQVTVPPANNQNSNKDTTKMEGQKEITETIYQDYNNKYIVGDNLELLGKIIDL